MWFGFVFLRIVLENMKFEQESLTQPLKTHLRQSFGEAAVVSVVPGWGGGDGGHQTQDFSLPKHSFLLG